MTLHAMPEVARSLEQQAAVIATDAAARLLAGRPDKGLDVDAETAVVWTDHLKQRVYELCAALAAGQVKMFVKRVTWSRDAMQARQIGPEELQRSLVCLREAIDAYVEGEALAATRDCLDHAIASLSDQRISAEQPGLDAGLRLDRIAMRYIQAVIAGNIIPGMSIVLDAVNDGLSERDAILRILLPAQREVGRLWHQNEISVAEEHMVTMTTQRLMAVLANLVRREPDTGRTVIAAAVAGNIHDIGIRAIAYLIEFRGWRTIYLGPDVPKSDFPAAVASFEADLIMLSLALSSQIPALQRTIDALRRGPAANVRIMIGGNGLAGAPDLWKELGADGYAATAEAALALADELVPAR